MLSGKSHEDFGLTPMILLLANSVVCLDEPLYFYVRRDNSITKTTDYTKIKKNVYDALYHFDTLYRFVKTIDITDNNKSIILSYLANSLIIKIPSLHSNDKKEYISELKQRKVTDMLLQDSIRRRVKKFIVKVRFILL